MLMAYPVTILALSLISVCVFGFNLGKADNYLPQIGAGDENLPHTGGADPAQVVAKALLCFNDKYTQIYSSCGEAYRLTESGNLNVPPEYVDQYCQGPCLTETDLVLSCLENILSHFLFYNEATIKDVRETIKAGCGYGPDRGDFNVAEHIKAEEGAAARMGLNYSLLFRILPLILGVLYL
ncbi:hypothetical protein LguiA_001017 [Lonicera macranthoides]